MPGVGQRVQSAQLLLVVAELRKGVAERRGDEKVRLLECLAAEDALHQADGYDFGIRERRVRVGRLAPGADEGMLFQIVVDEQRGLTFGRKRIYSSWSFSQDP